MFFSETAQSMLEMGWYMPFAWWVMFPNVWRGVCRQFIRKDENNVYALHARTSE
jgi:hypothetical protein